MTQRALIPEPIKSPTLAFIALLLDAWDVHIRASKTGIQIRGNIPIVTEKDENFVTIARTSA